MNNQSNLVSNFPEVLLEGITEHIVHLSGKPGSGKTGRAIKLATEAWLRGYSIFMITPKADDVKQCFKEIDIYVQKTPLKLQTIDSFVSKSLLNGKSENEWEYLRNKLNRVVAREEKQHGKVLVIFDEYEAISPSLESIKTLIDEVKSKPVKLVLVGGSESYFG